MTADKIVEYTETSPKDGTALDIDEEAVTCRECGWYAVFESWLAAERGE